MAPMSPSSANPTGLSQKRAAARFSASLHRIHIDPTSNDPHERSSHRRTGRHGGGKPSAGSSWMGSPLITFLHMHAITPVSGHVHGPRTRSRTYLWRSLGWDGGRAFHLSALTEAAPLTAFPSKFVKAVEAQQSLNHLGPSTGVSDVYYWAHQL